MFINICTSPPVANQYKKWGRKAEWLGFESRKWRRDDNTP